MATSKQSFVRGTKSQYSVSAQREEEIHVKALLTTMYVHTGSVPGLQPYPLARPGASQDATVVPLLIPSLCSNQPLPSLTFSIESSSALQQPRLGAPATLSRPRSIGKHVCPHCSKDCLKPSVLEKHLRCHTGERPYPCTTCGISFKTQSNLYKHKRTQAHVRLSNESDKDTFSSQESMDISNDNCVSPEDSADLKKSDSIFPAVSVVKHGQVSSTEGKTGTDWPIHKTAIVGLSTTLAVQGKVNYLSKNVELSSDGKDSSAPKKTNSSSENGRALQTPIRTPIQRQKALFSKPHFFPMSQAKSQSHDSTDSGFSDSSEYHSSSSHGVCLHDPSMESLPETAMEQQEPGTSQASIDMTPDDHKSKVSIWEKQKLEEHISKLIYENSVLVEDKQLENVRPRKTVLSKQGSIDLPVPYTYKDSFHFEIRNSKHISSSQKQDRGGVASYSSVPTQHSTSLEHAPLTRSSSLPFTVGGKYTDGAINLNLSRRCSAGHVYPFRTTDQQAPSHRSLVRQVAVDCIPTSEGSLVDRGSLSSLSSDGDSTDIWTESSIKGNYKKKTRKFDYTKWHTYKGGTFRKLYNTDGDSALKTKNIAHNIAQTESQEMQIGQPKDNASVSLNFTSCSVLCLSQTGDMSLAHIPNQTISSYMLLKSSPLEKSVEEHKQILSLQNDPKGSCTSFENSDARSADVEKEEIALAASCHIPSERKKQRIGNDVHMHSMPSFKMGQEHANLCGLLSQPLLSTCGAHGSIQVPAQKVNAPNLHQFSNPNHLLCKATSPVFCLINMSGTSDTHSVSTSNPTVFEATTSFPPKYQLKIPCSTDGVLASFSGSTLACNTSPKIQAFRQSHQTTVLCHSENSLPCSQQCQGASTPFDQSKQGHVCTMPIIPVSSSGQNQTNTLSKELTQLQPTTPTSASLVLPVTLPTVQHEIPSLHNKCTTDVVENRSTGPASSALFNPPKPCSASKNIQSVTSLNTVSTVSCCSESIETIQIFSSAATLPTVQYRPASPVFTFGKCPGPTADTQPTVYESTLNSTAPKISTGDFQASQSERNILLSGSAQSQAQNTFYVRTADLQIVMQLISDEQLALIEPHIEIPDFKPTENYSVSCSNPVISSNCTSHRSFSLDVLNETNVCVAQDMENIGDMDKPIDKLMFTSCGFANSEHKSENAGSLNLQNAKKYAGANFNLQCVSSWSHPQTKFHISTSVDYNKNSSERFYEPHKIPKNSQDRQSAALNVTTLESHHKQVAGDKLSELLLVNKSNEMRKDAKEHCSACNLNLGNSPDPRVTFRQDQTSIDMEQELKTTVLKERFCLMKSNHTHMIKNTEPVEPNKTRHLMPVTSSGDGEGVQTIRTSKFGSCISEIPVTSTESQHSKMQPGQNKSCWTRCSTSDLATREMNACGTILSCRPGTQGNETCYPGQTPTQYEIQQTFGLDLGNFENHTDTIKTYCMMPNRTSNCIFWDSAKYGEVPVHTHHVSLDIFTGPGECGTLKRLRFQKDPGEVNNESVSKETEKAVKDEEKQSTKMADMDNTCQKCENNGKQVETKVACCEDHQPAAQAQPHLSQKVINASLNISVPSLHDKFIVANNTKPSVNRQPQGQEGCSNYTKRDSKDEIFGKGIPLGNNQKKTGSLGYEVVSGLGVAGYANQVCRHLWVHPLLVNTMQKESRKETQTRNITTHWNCSKCTQAQVISPQHKLMSTTVSASVLQNQCGASTEVVTSMTPSSCSNTLHQTFSQMPQNNQIFSIASNLTDSKLFYSGSSSYLEQEDSSSSSSDDEQKLVIELE